MDFYPILDENQRKLQNSCVALIGGGGKTNLMLKLATEFAQIFPKVLLTSLTKSEFREDTILLDDISGKLNFAQNPLFLMKSRQNRRKLIGISETDLSKIYHSANLTFFECDGARKSPLKIHNEIDPIVPKISTHVIILVGADAMDTKLSDGKIHRPDLFKKHWEINNDFMLDCEFIAEVVTSKKGYLSKINHEPKLIYFVNKANKFPENAKILAEAIFEKSQKPTFFGSVFSGFWEKI